MDSTGTTSYTWDFENRLTSVTLPASGGTVTFKYDPLWRRIYKSSSSATSVFAYDGDNLVEEVNSSGAAVARYAQARTIDEPLAMLRGGAVSFYDADGLGSVTSLSNSAGALAQTYTFDSFGNQTTSSGSLTNPLRFTGREFDTETNLSYNRARQLDSKSGRFLTEDPVRYRGGLNFYKYAFNNPTDFADPLGLSPECYWVGSIQIGDPWTTATRQYTTPWELAASPEGGGSDEGPKGVGQGKGILAPETISCVWRRNYVRKVWETRLYLNTFLCVDHLACGLDLVWFEFSTDTKTVYAGEKPGGTETKVKSAWSIWGMVDCSTPGMGP